MKRPFFPPVDRADQSGLLCWGGRADPRTLLDAYRNGIFPWPHEGYPLLWFAPPERAVLCFDELRVNSRLRRSLRSEGFEITFDTAFARVIAACAGPRIVEGELDGGTWITPELIEGYSALHALGWVHSVEAWQKGELVGGLYGVLIGAHFCGESMFHLAPNASKACVVALVERLKAHGATWLDIETMTPHFERLGAREIPRDEFMNWKREAQNQKKAW